MENVLKGEISAFTLSIAHFSAHSNERSFSNIFDSSLLQVFQPCNGKKKKEGMESRD